MQKKAQGHRLRSGRYSYAGQVYLITMVASRRECVFADFHNARCVVKVLQQEQRLQRADTLAFVVMPDHVHWLMQLRDGMTLARCVQGVKSMVSRQIGRAVWQDGFHDRAMRREDDLQAIARYIVANPLRAGLVAQLSEFAHWDACWLTGDHALL
jgi:putative transposase